VCVSSKILLGFFLKATHNYKSLIAHYDATPCTKKLMAMVSLVRYNETEKRFNFHEIYLKQTESDLRGG